MIDGFLLVFGQELILKRKLTGSQRKVSHKVPILGFSATFSRPDRESLARVFEKIVFHVDTPIMVHEGWLAPARSTSVYADLDLDSVPNQATTGDFRTSWPSETVNIQEANQLVVKTYLEKCRSRRSTLAFCVNRKHMKDLARAFQDAGIDARTIDGTTPSRVRAETLRDFKEEKFPVLVNCEILAEGTDIPEVSTIFDVFRVPQTSRWDVLCRFQAGMLMSRSTVLFWRVPRRARTS